MSRRLINSGWLGFCLVLGLIFFSRPAPAAVGLFGSFFYEDTGTSITILNYQTRAVGAVVIPSTIDGKPVTVISNGAFQFQETLSAISIPNTVVSIGPSAFFYCHELTDLVIPGSVTSIGDNAFYKCSKLTNLTLSNGLVTIGAAAFGICTSLVSVYIPASVSTIGDNAFDYASSLTIFTVDAANANYSSQADVLFNKTKTTLLKCPALKSGPYTLPVSVTKITHSAFSGCVNLTSLTIPAGLNEIGDYAFSRCTGMADYVVDNSNTMFSSQNGVLFDKVKSRLLQYPAGKTGAYTIPGSVSDIATRAFSQCAGLSSIAIPNSVTSLGIGAFESCRSLTSVSIPTSITSIAGSAFYYCTSLESVSIGSNVSSIGDNAFYNCTALKSLTIPANVTTIGSSVFSYCTSLTTVTIPSTLTSVSFSIFAYCTGLKSAIIAEGVTIISSYAFNRCSGLTSVTIPASVTSISNEAFSYCNAMASVIFKGNAPALSGTSVFQNSATGASIYYPTMYYYEGATGFTLSPWNGSPYTSINMGAVSPVKPWLLSKGLAYDADLQSMPNNDGVPLLVAYALNLDPTTNLAGKLPKPTLAGNQMSLPFYAGSEGVTYAVEASTDLKAWSTEGVMLGAPDASGTRMATLPTTGAGAFLRLKLSY